VTGCCDPRGCDDIFGSRFAVHRARRYRRHGLDPTERRIVEFLVRRGVEGSSVLEVGGGLGEIQIELLRAGASRATNLELVDAYEAEARRLADEAGVGDRVRRHLVDIAVTPQQVERADVVVLHRVVCCYPDAGRLLAAAADHAGGVLVFSHPPRNLVSRGILAVQNAFFRLTGKTFRTFAHPPQEMVGVLRRHGLRPVYEHRGTVWHVMGLERPGAPARQQGRT
jgi:magnesium-protoporphyrin O-methyltransferase